MPKLKLVLRCISGFRFRLNNDRRLLVIAEQNLFAFVTSGIAVLNEIQIIQLSCVGIQFSDRAFGLMSSATLGLCKTMFVFEN